MKKGVVGRSIQEEGRLDLLHRIVREQLSTERISLADAFRTQLGSKICPRVYYVDTAREGYVPH